MKYSGKIGFWEDDLEIRPGVTKPGIVEKTYTGDIIKTNQRWNQSQESSNDDIKINNNISIIVDLYFQQNFSSIKYITFMGTKWKVSAVQIQYPRALVEIGEVWNGFDNGSED